MKIRLLYVLLVIMLLPLNVFANSVIESQYQNGVYTIKGISDVKKMPVKIEILNNAVTFNDLKDVALSNTKDLYLYVDLINADEEGNFAFNVPVAVQDSNHMVRVTFFGSENPIIKNFGTYTAEQVTSSINQFLNESNKTNVMLSDLINSYYGGMGINYMDFSKIDDTRVPVLYANIINKLEENSTVAELLNLISANIAVELINSCDTAEDIATALNDYSESLGLENNLTFTAWGKSTDSIKLAVSSSLIGGDFTLETLISYFENSVIITELNTSLWNELAGVLEKYKSRIGLNLDTLSAISSDTVYKNVMIDLKSQINKGDVYNTSQIQTALNAAINKYPQSTSKPSPGGGGGGGGSGTSYVAHTANDEAGDLTAPPALAFDDIGGVEWAKIAILKLNDRGILNGKGNSKFAPNDFITREEFTAILMRSFAVKCDNPGNSFVDVSPDRWSYEYVEAAKEKGIINGIADNVFGATDNIIRQDMAVISYKAAAAYGARFEGREKMEFDDYAQISEYAKQGIDMLSGAKVINGTPNGFEPLRGCTRAEAAQVVYSLLQYCEIIK